MKTRSMTSSVEVLSEEVLDRIVSSLESLPSLAIVARVSKRFNRIAMPHLYAKVSFTNAANSYNTAGRYLCPFTFMMLQKPEIAALVQSFSIRPGYTINEDQPSSAHDWPDHPELESLLHDAIDLHEQNPAESRLWCERIRSGKVEAAILALLLPKLTNLRFLDVPFDREYSSDTGQETHYTLSMLKQAAKKQVVVNEYPVFSKLTDIIIPGVNDKYPDPPDWFGACVGLPVIKRLYGFNQGNEDFDSSTSTFDDLVAGNSTVQFIQLRNSKLHITNLYSLLRAPKSLRTFMYELGNTWAWTEVKTSAIQSALDYQRGNLERISLEHSEFYPFGFDNGDELTPMTFSAFTALKHLRIAPIFLYGDETLRLGDGDAVRLADAPEVSKDEIEATSMVLKNALPPQLETLELTYCNDYSTLKRLAASLREIFAYKEEKFKELRKITMHILNAKAVDWKLDLFTTLPWRAKGVQFVVKIEQLVNYTEKEFQTRRWGWDGEVEWGECINGQRGPTTVLYDSDSQ